MLVVIMAIGAAIAGVGIGGRWLMLINAGTIMFIAAAAFVSRLSAFDLVVSVVMVVLGFVAGLEWRRRRRRLSRRLAAGGTAWGAWPGVSDSGSMSCSGYRFGGGDSGSGGATESWSDWSSDSGGSGGGDSGGGGGGDGSD